MARIFIVEDDGGTQMLLNAILTAKGHKIIGTVDNAEVAKTAIMFSRPDLCFIDVNLATSETGIDVAEFILERSLTKIIIMSSDDHPTLPVPFLQKPIRPQNVLAAIDHALGYDRS